MPGDYAIEDGSLVITVEQDPVIQKFTPEQIDDGIAKAEADKATAQGWLDLWNGRKEILDSLAGS